MSTNEALDAARDSLKACLDPSILNPPVLARRIEALARAVAREVMDEWESDALHESMHGPIDDSPVQPGDGIKSSDQVGGREDDLIERLRAKRIQKTDGSWEGIVTETPDPDCIEAAERIRTVEQERDGAVFDYKQADERAAKAEAALATLREQVGKATLIKYEDDETDNDWKRGWNAAADQLHALQTELSALSPVPGKADE